MFDTWFDALRDRATQARIHARIRRLANGNAGDHRNLKGGVSELRIDVGPGYRVYYCLREKTVYLLLCGGNKSTQQIDIARAQDMAGEIWD